MSDFIYSLLPATFGEIVQACRDKGYKIGGDSVSSSDSGRRSPG